MNDDSQNTQTSTNDEDNVGSTYSNALYADSDENNNEQTAELGKGLGDDAYSTFDSDDSTLTADNNEDETETGINSADADDLNPNMDQMGDVVVDESINN